MNRAPKLFLWLAAFLIGFSTAQIRRAYPNDDLNDNFDVSYDGNFNAQLATHLHDPGVLASQRMQLELAEKVIFGSGWSGVFGFRAWDEPVYAMYPSRYPTELAEQDSRQITPRDFYVEHKSENLLLRLGNQQVVWGEAFGYFYSDIVNPKDLRFGGFGELSEVRNQTPMLNAKWISGDFSLQGIWIPAPFFTILPLPGSDFFPSQDLVPVNNLIINREGSLPISRTNQEAGLRASYLLGTVDLSLFGMTYFDRMPYYSIDPSSPIPTGLTLDEHHSRVTSVGLTATAELESLVFRFEGLETMDRQLPAVANNTVVAVQSNDYTYVVGMDLPTFEQFNVGVQWSQDILNAQANYLLRDRIQSLVSLRAQRTLFLNQNIELLYTFQTSDGGSRAEAEYLLPLSDQLETRFGLDVLAGSATSDFGRTQEGSRAYMLLKYYFKG